MYVFDGQRIDTCLFSRCKEELVSRISKERPIRIPQLLAGRMTVMTALALSPGGSACLLCSFADRSSSMGTEADLLARLIAHEEDAYKTRIHQYTERLWSVARRFLRCDADCADAVQETFVAAYRHLPSFQGEARLGTWLHRILVNACLTVLRSRGRHPSVRLKDVPYSTRSGVTHPGSPQQGFEIRSASKGRRNPNPCLRCGLPLCVIPQ